jgi:hypothetical protein
MGRVRVKRHQYLCLWVGLLVILAGGGCTSQQSLSKEEQANQSRVDSLVSSVLFDNELDEEASYNIHRDGYIVIKFAESVPFAKYNHVVDVLRSNKTIKGLRAEQSGKEVCPIKTLR